MIFNPRRRKAGVVLYRHTDEWHFEVLLVSARKFPGSWVFPCGTLETGESAQAAAERECHEESGYLAEIGPQVGRARANRHSYTFFLARIKGDTGEYEADRQLKWVPLEQLVTGVPQPFQGVAKRAVKMLSAGKGI